MKLRNNCYKVVYIVRTQALFIFTAVGYSIRKKLITGNWLVVISY